MAGGIYIQFRCLFLLAFYLYIMLTHGGYFSHPNEVIGTATALMTEYKSAPIPIHVEREPLNGSIKPLMVKWSPPHVGVVKANWDVAVDMKNGVLLEILVVIYKLYLVMWNF
jgi:hypothetical protein